MKLEPDLRESFMVEAATDDRSASQIVRERMRGSIEQRRKAREYREFMRRKAEIAHADVRAGRVRSSEEVEADFAARYEAVSE